MASLLRTASFVLAVTALSLAVFPVSAQLPKDVDDVATNAKLAGGTLYESVQKVINVLLTLVGILAVIVLIYGGVKYIISLGDEGQAEKAKHVILYAVIGLIIIGLSAVMVNFVLGAIRVQGGGGGGGGGGGAGNIPGVTFPKQIQTSSMHILVFQKEVRAA